MAYGHSITKVIDNVPSEKLEGLTLRSRKEAWINQEETMFIPIYGLVLYIDGDFYAYDIENQLIGIIDKPIAINYIKLMWFLESSNTTY